MAADKSVKGNNIGHNLMENVDNSYMKESRICSAGYRIQVKLMQKSEQIEKLTVQ